MRPLSRVTLFWFALFADTIGIDLPRCAGVCRVVGRVRRIGTVTMNNYANG
jgi:hypothetical protein